MTADDGEREAVADTVEAYRATYEAARAEYQDAIELYRSAVRGIAGDRVAWREYACAALTGMLAARLVPPHELHRADGLAYAAEIADDMLALERARYGGPDGHEER